MLLLKGDKEMLFVKGYFREKSGGLVVPLLIRDFRKSLCLFNSALSGALLIILLGYTHLRHLLPVLFNHCSPSSNPLHFLLYFPLPLRHLSLGILLPIVILPFQPSHLFLQLSHHLPSSCLLLHNLLFLLPNQFSQFSNPSLLIFDRLGERLNRLN